MVVGIDDGQKNGINFIPFVCPSRTPIRAGRARGRGMGVGIDDGQRIVQCFLPIRLSLSKTPRERR